MDSDYVSTLATVYQVVNEDFYNSNVNWAEYVKKRDSQLLSYSHIFQKADREAELQAAATNYPVASQLFDQFKDTLGFKNKRPRSDHQSLAHKHKKHNREKRSRSDSKNKLKSLQNGTDHSYTVLKKKQSQLSNSKKSHNQQQPLCPQITCHHPSNPKQKISSNCSVFQTSSRSKKLHRKHSSNHSHTKQYHTSESFHKKDTAGQALSEGDILDIEEEENKDLSECDQKLQQLNETLPIQRLCTYLCNKNQYCDKVSGTIAVKVFSEMGDELILSKSETIMNASLMYTSTHNDTKTASDWEISNSLDEPFQQLSDQDLQLNFQTENTKPKFDVKKTQNDMLLEFKNANTIYDAANPSIAQVQLNAIDESCLKFEPATINNSIKKTNNDGDETQRTLPLNMIHSCNYNSLSGSTEVLNQSDILNEELLKDAQVSNEQEKKTIYVINKDTKTAVSWFSDTSLEDVKSAVLCACDAIMDSGFILRQVTLEKKSDNVTPYLFEKLTSEIMIDGESYICYSGRSYDFEEFDLLEHENTYMLEAAKERKELESVRGERWRRIIVPINPLLHVEVAKAIFLMKRGTNLLKHNSYGYPHLRQFQLSADCERLLWYSAVKSRLASLVQIDTISEIKLGQISDNFRAHPIPCLANLSFTLVYGPLDYTLDLTCKDEREFDNWVLGIKAIMYHKRGKKISKQQLLGHSKTFQKAMKAENASFTWSDVPEIVKNDAYSHFPCEIDGNVSFRDVVERLRNGQKRQADLMAKVKKLSIKPQPQPDSTLLSLASNSNVKTEGDILELKQFEEDKELETTRMLQLFDCTCVELQKVSNSLTELCYTKFTDPDIDRVANSCSKKSLLASSDSVIPPPSLGIWNIVANQITDTVASLFSYEDEKQFNFTASEKRELNRINHELWKAEVDLENIEDMYSRVVDPFWDPSKILRMVSDVNYKLSDEISKLSAALNDFFANTHS